MSMKVSQVLRELLGLGTKPREKSLNMPEDAKDVSKNLSLVITKGTGRWGEDISPVKALLVVMDATQQLMDWKNRGGRYTYTVPAFLYQGVELYSSCIIFLRTFSSHRHKNR